MRRWVKVSHLVGATKVAVTVMDGELSAKWTVKTYLGNIKDATRSAEASALKALEELRLASEPHVVEEVS